jgi:hypothetical protein
VIERQCIEFYAVPPNKGMELTVKSDTPFERRRAKGAPLLPAAHPQRLASGKRMCEISAIFRA